jgi:REP element-mobilizing transposase RayT
MKPGELYFYTSTICQWKHLLSDPWFASVILDSLFYLQQKKRIRVYGFVIMPNHIHLIWQMTAYNGGETPAASLMKYTAHQFEVRLRERNPLELEDYLVNWNTRKYNFWQPNPHWFILYQEKTLIQKLSYIHNNPLQPHWNLAQMPEAYPWSSALFYETGINRFSFLEHYMDFY